MSPFQHGEVYVTEDGAETDLDLGHYERFVDEFLSRNSNHTTGSIYDRIIRRERKGEYLGSTVQVIPHVTDEIKRRVTLAGRLARRRRGHHRDRRHGRRHREPAVPRGASASSETRSAATTCMYIHCTLVPYIDVAGELKTKPTQHSVQELRRIGIRPTSSCAASRRPLSRDMREKIALFADVPVDAVISAPRRRRTSTRSRSRCRPRGSTGSPASGSASSTGPPDMREWEAMVDRIRPPRAACGSRSSASTSSSRTPTCRSSRRSTTPRIHHGTRLEVVWVDAETLSVEEAERRLAQVDGILIPGGFGIRGIEGKIAAVRFAREQRGALPGHLPRDAGARSSSSPATSSGSRTPTRASSTPTTPYPVIDLLPEQKRRVGHGRDDAARLRPGARWPTARWHERAYGESVVYERHRHRYEVNNSLRPRLVAQGLVVSGTSPDERLVEIVELRDHPWFCASQFHPEFKSRPNRPQPLFRDFVGAAVARTSAAPSARGAGREPAPA